MNIIIIIATFLISAVIFTFVGIMLRKKTAESKIGSAEQEAKRILDSAKVEAENSKKQAIFSAKEEIMVARNDLDQEIKERRSEIQVQERRMLQKEESLEKRGETLERKERELEVKHQELDDKKKDLEEIIQKEHSELERISNLTTEEAKVQLLSETEEAIKNEKAALLFLSF